MCRAFLTFICTWKTFGYSMAVYLAAITGINQSLYESPVIDGASKPPEYWSVYFRPWIISTSASLL